MVRACMRESTTSMMIEIRAKKPARARAEAPCLKSGGISIDGQAETDAGEAENRNSPRRAGWRKDSRRIPGRLQSISGRQRLIAAEILPLCELLVRSTDQICLCSVIGAFQFLEVDQAPVTELFVGEDRTQFVHAVERHAGTAHNASQRVFGDDHRQT